MKIKIKIRPTYNIKGLPFAGKRRKNFSNKQKKKQLQQHRLSSIIKKQLKQKQLDEINFIDHLEESLSELTLVPILKDSCQSPLPSIEEHERYYENVNIVDMKSARELQEKLQNLQQPKKSLSQDEKIKSWEGILLKISTLLVRLKDCIKLKEDGTVLFLLIQLALQSGPLKGSKAGYFRRAKLDTNAVIKAQKFLNRIGPLVELHLNFNDKQKQQVQTWIENADREISKRNFEKKKEKK